ISGVCATTLDLPELVHINLGLNALVMNGHDNNSTLRMRNLPKLDTITTVGKSYSFEDPHHVILENMPSLRNVLLVKGNAFAHKEDVRIQDIGALSSFFKSCVSFKHQSFQYHSSSLLIIPCKHDKLE
ncbi:hypothetical protein AV274_0952, partial [Blastocystis sp. ATCC 50177/Nand II]